MSTSQPGSSVSVPEKAIWHLRDLVCHFGFHDAEMRQTPMGRDIAMIGKHLPALAGITHDPAPNELADVFQRYGWGDEPITLEAALDLADSIRVPPHDTSSRLATRRQAMANGN